MEIKFTVPGEPVAKGRPRFRRFGKNVVTYTPSRTKKYENQVAKCWKEQSGLSFDKGVPLRADIECYMAIPSSLSKKKREELVGKPCIKKSDADNFVKIYLDALNGKAYYDDSAIVAVSVSKIYSNFPRAEIKISNYDKHTVCPIYYIDDEGERN